MSDYFAPPLIEWALLHGEAVDHSQRELDPSEWRDDIVDTLSSQFCEQVERFDNAGPHEFTAIDRAMTIERMYERKSCRESYALDLSKEYSNSAATYGNIDNDVYVITYQVAVKVSEVTSGSDTPFAAMIRSIEREVEVEKNDKHEREVAERNAEIEKLKARLAELGDPIRPR